MPEMQLVLVQTSTITMADNSDVLAAKEAFDISKPSIFKFALSLRGNHTNRLICRCALIFWQSVLNPVAETDHLVPR